MSTTYLLDLRDVIRSLVAELPEPSEIWLFGSRAQQTGSKRSDVDLLVIDRRARLTTESLVDWRMADKERAPLDLFLSRDGRIADSVVNGSLLKDDRSLPMLLGAQLLWSDQTGMGDAQLPWLQEFRRGIRYEMTIIPTDFSAALEALPEELVRMGLPNTLLGTDWGSVATNTAAVLARAVDAATRLGPKAKTLTKDVVIPQNEYDAQNLFYLVLRPWLPDVELNPYMITYGGQQKYADISAADSQLVIEIKFVSDASSAAAVIKQLSGLSRFYSQQPRVKALVFAILVKDGVSWDGLKVEYEFSSWDRQPVVVTRSIRLP